MCVGGKIIANAVPFCIVGVSRLPLAVRGYSAKLPTICSNCVFFGEGVGDRTSLTAMEKLLLPGVRFDPKAAAGLVKIWCGPGGTDGSGTEFCFQ